MKTTINNALIAKLQPKAKPYDVRDTRLIGFLLRVNISGKLVYMVEYARGKRITIGRSDVLTPVQARDEARAILGDYARGITPDDKIKIKGKKAYTLNAYIETEYAPWLEANRKSGKETIKRIKRCFFKKFAETKLENFTPLMIERWRTDRLNGGIKNATVNRDITALKSALSKAVIWELIELHPLAKVKLSKEDSSTKIRYLDVEEEQRLRQVLKDRDKEMRLARANANKWREKRGYELFSTITDGEFADHLKPMILVSLNTGLRKNELFSLSWDDVDLDRALITVVGSKAKSGKTRHVPLNNEALKTLQQWQKQNDRCGYVFKNKDGEKFDNVKKSWGGVLNRAGIKDFRWHDMRHHFASRLVMAGVDLNTVRELLGHSGIQMTLRYAHLAPEHKAQAVAKLLKFGV